MRNRSGAVLPGLLLIALGAWLLALTLGVPLPGFDKIWPVLPLVFGLAALVRFFAEGRRHDGLVISGVAAVLLSAFFLTITLGPLSWADLGRWWPIFIVIGGLAFLAQWLARPDEHSLLIPAVLALLVGLGALALTLRLAGFTLSDQLIRLWPLLLILAGLGLLANYVVSGRKKE
jgi:hypothetical protein